MEQEEFVEKTRERVATERERMREELSRLFPDGHVYRSEAPFLLIDVGERSVASIVKGAKERGVAIRDARTFDGLNSHVRVAIRVPAENDRLLSVISDV